MPPQKIMKLAKAYSGTQSVVRAIRLIKLFHGAKPDLSFAEIQKRSGLNRSTAFRMLTALEAEGMIERDPQTEGYRLGVEIRVLGSLAAAHGTLGELVPLPDSTPAPMPVAARIEPAHASPAPSSHVAASA